MKTGELLAIFGLLLVVLSGTASASAAQPPPGGWGSLADPLQWMWPMRRTVGGVDPVITNAWGLGRIYAHRGVDIMYPRSSALPAGTPYPQFDNGSIRHYVPTNTPAVAASAGSLWSAGKDAHGFFVILAHNNGISTTYRHLSALFLPWAAKGVIIDEHTKKPILDSSGRPTVLGVQKGQPLGIIGYDPTDARHVVHLHFELKTGTQDIDPREFMQTWEIM